MNDSDHPDPDLIGAAREEAQSRGVLPATASPSGEGAGDVIDRYELLEEIGEGGMGTVWRARQSEPVKRDVALKIIKLGMDTREVVVRFEAERQALALMDHPHIAKVLDGGATEGGRPYFVMELVRGTPITEYCDQASLGLRERLELFTKVCEGIQHAHQKGIIHRDIKPSNVLVTLHDGGPLPKVIDFGIAKATSAELTQKTLFTQLGQIIGTPEYMAPEQAEMSGLDIDTRADVYALGALLYEMLTGAKLFEMRDVLEVGFQELLRVIREVEPPRPSTRVSTMRAGASPVAAKRHANVESLARLLQGDLDWIVMKALDKDRARRYETANGFAADVRRFLDQEPVVAAPPSATYRLRKFVRRRRKTVVAVGVIAFLLIAGSVGTGIGWWNTKRANTALGVALAEKDAALAEEERQRTLAQESATRAVAAETDALAEAKRATSAEAKATQRAAELQQVADFQSEQLSRIDVELMGSRMRRALVEAVDEAQRAPVTAHLSEVNFTNLAMKTLEENLFERTIQAIDAQFVEQRLVQAQLLQSLSVTLFDLGLFELASDTQRRCLAQRRELLGDEHPDTLASIHSTSRLSRARGDLVASETLAREAREAARRVLGEGDPITLQSATNLVEVLLEQGKISEAEPVCLELLENARRFLGDEHVVTIAAISSTGHFYWSQARLQDAEPFVRETLELSRRVFGNDEARTLSALNNVGMLLRDQGRWEEALPFLREATSEMSRVLGDENRETLTTRCNLALLLTMQGKLAEAAPLAYEAHETTHRVLGSTNQITLLAAHTLGFVRERQGEYAEAGMHYREAVEGYLRAFGNAHHLSLRLFIDLQRLYGLQVTEQVREVGEQHPAVLATQRDLALLLAEFDRGPEATELLQDCLEVQLESLGSDHPDTLQALHDIASLYLRQGRSEEAEQVFSECLEMRAEVLGKAHPSTLETLEALTRLYVDGDRPGEALPGARRLVERTPKGSASATERRRLLEELEARRSD